MDLRQHASSEKVLALRRNCWMVETGLQYCKEVLYIPINAVIFVCQYILLFSFRHTLCGKLFLVVIDNIIQTKDCGGVDFCVGLESSPDLVGAMHKRSQ